MKSPAAEQSPLVGSRSSEAHLPTVLSERVVLHVVLNAVVQGAPATNMPTINDNYNKSNINNDNDNNGD